MTLCKPLGILWSHITYLKKSIEDITHLIEPLLGLFEIAYTNSRELYCTDRKLSKSFICYLSPATILWDKYYFIYILQVRETGT